MGRCRQPFCRVINVDHVGRVRRAAIPDGRQTIRAYGDVRNLLILPRRIGHRDAGHRVDGAVGRPHLGHLCGGGMLGAGMLARGLHPRLGAVRVQRT